MTFYDIWHTYGQWRLYTNCKILCQSLTGILQDDCNPPFVHWLACREMAKRRKSNDGAAVTVTWMTDEASARKGGRPLRVTKSGDVWIIGGSIQLGSWLIGAPKNEVLIHKARKLLDLPTLRASWGIFSFHLQICRS